VTRLTRIASSSSATLLALTLLAGCHSKEKPEADLPKVNIDTMVVRSSNITDALQIAAHVEVDPTRVVHIFPPLSGRILSLPVIPGQEVRKGQTVATLQSGDVASARADFEKASAESARADRALDRGKLLLQHEVLSQAAFYELQATDQTAHSELERTRQRLHELGFSEKGTSDVATIAAPISGTVTDIGTATGELQRSLETSTGIATIANLDTVWVVGDVFERDLALLKRSSSVDVTLQAYPGEVFHGTLANIGDAFDPTTHTLKARVVLNNPGHRLKPQMFASLKVARPVMQTILVPATAVVHDGEATSVYIASADGKYTQRPVQTGATHGDTIEITSGLQDSERIVKAGTSFLRAPVGD
jgi:cobalt-zinc-cadmium efflux system membrane fusion protein